MVEFPWHRIHNGDRFQDLVGCLLIHEVSKHAVTFGRAGRDYGIDGLFNGDYEALSGHWRFQAKYSNDLDNLKKTLKDSKGEKGEVTRVLDYLGAKVGTKAHELWNGVTQYRLVTNQKLLPQDRQEILGLLAPLAGKGVEVDVWDGDKVEKLCRGQPFVMRQFFGEDLPLFVPVAEFRRQLLRGPFGRYYVDLPFAERNGFVEMACQFLTTDGEAILVRGTGGSGKTRALIELGARLDAMPNYDVRFVQREAETFDAQVKELDERHSYMVIVDEADRFQHLDRLLFLATKHRAFGGRMKLILACRGATSEPVVNALYRFLEQAKVKEFDLPKLATAPEEFARELGYNGEQAEALAELADGIPLWLVLAHEALESETPFKDLVKDKVVTNHVRMYLREIVPGSQSLHMNALNVLAALEPVDITDASARGMLAKLLHRPTHEVMRVVADLQQAGIVEQRGRFVRITPDVVSDYILAQAMVTQTGVPTDFNAALVQETVPNRRRLFNNLARAEYLTGQRILDVPIADMLQGIDTLPERDQCEVLHDVAVLAHVRPDDFMRLVDRLIPPSRISHATESGSQAEVSEALATTVTNTIVGVMRSPQHTACAIEQLGHLYECSPALSSVRVLVAKAVKDNLRFRRHLPFDVQDAAVEVFRRWWGDHKLPRTELIFGGLHSIFCWEFQETRSSGDKVTFSTHYLLPVPDIRQLREKAQNLLKSLLEAPEAEIRLEAIKLLHHAIGETIQATVWPRGQGGAPESDDAHQLAFTPNTTEYLLGEVGAFFDLVESRLRNEEDVAMLAELEDCVDWHAQHAPESSLKQRGLALKNDIRSRESYQFYTALIGKRATHEHELPFEMIAQQVVAADAPEQFLHDFRSVVERQPSAGYGSARFMLQEIARTAPSYAHRLLSLVDGEQPTIHSTYVGGLVAGLWLGGDHATLTLFLARGPRWRAAVANACSTLRPAWYSGLNLGQDHYAILRDLASDSDPNVHVQVAEFLTYITDANPEECLLVAELLTQHNNLKITGDRIASACGRILKARPSLRPQVLALMERFVVAPTVEGYWVADVLFALGATDPLWFVSFFEKRAQHADATEPHWNEFDVMPYRFHQPPLVSKLDEAALESALMRILRWHTISSRLRSDLSKMVATVAGNKLAAVPASDGLGGPPDHRVFDLVTRCVRTLMRAYPDAGQMEVIGLALEAFDGVPEKYDLIGEVISRATTFSSAEQRGIFSAFRSAVQSRGYSSSSGEDPPALVHELEMIRALGQKHLTDPTVQRFVQHVTSSIESQIQWSRRQDAEFYLE
jgi:hypothetical protein